MSTVFFEVQLSENLNDFNISTSAYFYSPDVLIFQLVVFFFFVITIKSTKQFVEFPSAFTILDWNDCKKCF